MVGPSSVMCPQGEARGPRVPRLAMYSSILADMPDARAETSAVISALSAPRMSTYLKATGGDEGRALELYGWNARVSAALMVPAHLAEVVTRNAVDEVLTCVYGEAWPWDPTFEISLPPHQQRSYSPRADLVSKRSNLVSTGQVVADLNFIFWERMFTKRHDGRLWSPHIVTLFPAAPRIEPGLLRNQVRTDLETIRHLRNRVAHHEPIFTRDLTADLRTIFDLIGMRSPETADLAYILEDVTQVLSERP